MLKVNLEIINILKFSLPIKYRISSSIFLNIFYISQ